MNELHQFVAKNHNKLVRADRETLVHVANQIDALKKGVKEKKAVIEAIELNLKHLKLIAETTLSLGLDPKHPYYDTNNRLILQKAIILARKLLQEA